MDECKPLPNAGSTPRSAQSASMAEMPGNTWTAWPSRRASRTSNQGLTLVHFSAQPKPILTHNTPKHQMMPVNTP